MSKYKELDRDVSVKQEPIEYDFKRVVRDNPMRTVPDVMDVYNCECGRRATLNRNNEYDKIRELFDEILKEAEACGMEWLGIETYKEKLNDILGERDEQG